MGIGIGDILGQGAGFALNQFLPGIASNMGLDPNMAQYAGGAGQALMGLLGIGGTGNTVAGLSSMGMQAMGVQGPLASILPQVLGFGANALTGGNGFAGIMNQGGGYLAAQTSSNMNNKWTNPVVAAEYNVKINQVIQSGMPAELKKILVLMLLGEEESEQSMELANVLAIPADANGNIPAPGSLAHLGSIFGNNMNPLQGGAGLGDILTGNAFRNLTKQEARAAGWAFGRPGGVMNNGQTEVLSKEVVMASMQYHESLSKTLKEMASNIMKMITDTWSSIVRNVR